MKELEKEFIGIGEVKDFRFKQILSNNYAYMYEVKNPDVYEVYYEVFERRINEQFGCVSYPKGKAFGIWAWCITDYDRAKEKFDWLTKRSEKRARELDNKQ